MRGVALAVVVVVLTGCAVSRQSSALMDRGDKLVQQGEYVAAGQAYDEVLVKYPDDGVAPRARAMRELLQARADIARLRDVLATRESELFVRETELGRLRQEVQRLSAEAERLRTDLENLKQIDLREERRRR